MLNLHTESPQLKCLAKAASAPAMKKLILTWDYE